MQHIKMKLELKLRKWSWENKNPMTTFLCLLIGNTF